MLTLRGEMTDDTMHGGHGNKTIRTHHDTTIFLRNTEMTADEVWACRYTD